MSDHRCAECRMHSYVGFISHGWYGKAWHCEPSCTYWHHGFHEVLCHIGDADPGAPT